MIQLTHSGIPRIESVGLTVDPHYRSLHWSLESRKTSQENVKAYLHLVGDIPSSETSDTVRNQIPQVIGSHEICSRYSRPRL